MGGVGALVPGERSLSLGTPGLHDESPLGFGGFICAPLRDYSEPINVCPQGNMA